MSAVALSLTFPGGSIDVRMDRSEGLVLAPASELIKSEILEFPSRPRFQIVHDGGLHAATIDHTTGLMWCVDSLGRAAAPDKGMPHADCMTRARDLRLLGFDDWRNAETAEVFTILDHSRADIAVDPEYFPRIRAAWHWLDTAYARDPASYAWYVDFDRGLVDWNYRSGQGFALAVHRVGQ